MNEVLVLDSLLHGMVQLVASAEMTIEERIGLYDAVIDYLLAKRREFVAQLSEGE